MWWPDTNTLQSQLSTCLLMHVCIQVDSVHSQLLNTLICCTKLWSAELICMWKQPSQISCCCINSWSIVCELWSNRLFAFLPELSCCSNSVPNSITSQAGNPSSNPSRLGLPLLIPSQVLSLAAILADAERRDSFKDSRIVLLKLCFIKRVVMIQN